MDASAAIASLLMVQLDGRSTNAQRAAALNELRVMQARPGYLQALAALPFARSLGAAVVIQSLILIKNTVAEAKLSDDVVIDTIVPRITPLLGHPEAAVRKHAAQILSKTVAVTDLLESRRFDLLGELQRAVLVAPHALQADGALLCLMYIAEDAAALLESDLAGRPLSVLVPFWISLLGNANPVVRERALKSLACFTGHFPPPLHEHAGDYLRALAALTKDPARGVAKKVIRGFSALLEHKQEILLPHLDAVALFCLEHVGAREPGVGVACVEFFNALLIELADPAPVVRPHVPRLVPLLCGHLQYTEDDVAMLWSDIQNDSNVPDRDEDVRPRLAGMRGHMRRGGYDDDEDEAVVEADGRLWTVRESAGKCLENLSRKLPAETLLPVLIPCLEAGLSSASWSAREAAVMGLGAVATGCEHCLEPYLPALVPFLVLQAADSAVLVRKIALWALGRFARWIGSSRPDLMPGIVHVVLARTHDDNKGVQFAATSSLDAFVENAPPSVLQPMLAYVLEALCAGVARTLQRAQANQLASTWDSLALCFTHLEVPRDVGAAVAPVLWAHFERASSLDAWLPSACFAMAKLVGVLAVDLANSIAPAVLSRCVAFCEEAIGIYEGAALAGGEDVFGEGDFDYVSWVLFLASAVLSRARVQGMNGDALLDVVCQCGAALGDAEVLKQALGVIADVARKADVLDRWHAYAEFCLRHCVPGDGDDGGGDDGEVVKCAVDALGVLAAGPQGLTPELARRVFVVVARIFASQERGEVWALGVDAALLAGVAAQRYPSLAVVPAECLRAWTRALIKLDESPDMMARAYAGWLRVMTADLASAVEHTPLVVKAALQFRASSELDGDLAAMVQGMRRANPGEFAKRFALLSADMQRAATARFSL